jgi:hypothetical protein
VSAPRWHLRFEEPVAVGPFVQWAERRIARLAGEYDDPTQAFVDRCGWTGESGVRRLHRHRSGEAIWADRHAIEDAIERYGGRWLDVYPEPWRDPITTAPATKRKPGSRIKAVRSDLGRSYVLTEGHLQEAHARHVDGESIRSIARELFGRADVHCASEKALVNALSGTFRARGWWTRTKAEATALSNVARATRPQCSHVHKSGPRKGERCARNCVGNDLTCWRHDPERIVEAVRRLREGDELAAAA